MASKAATETVADATPTTTTEATPAVENTAQPAQPAQSFVKPTPQQPVTHTAYFGTQPDAQNATSAATEGDKGKEAQTEGKVFTQAQIDAMIKERVERERAKYADYDELKTKATAADEATRTEAEKQAARLKELETQASTLAAERTKLQAENAFLAAASEIGLPGDAAYKLADMSKATFGDDGRITNAKELAAAVAQAYPGLVKRGASPNVVNPGRESAAQARTDADRRADYFGGGNSFMWRGGGVKMPVSAGSTGE